MISIAQVRELSEKYKISLGEALNFLRAGIDPGNSSLYIPVKTAARIMLKSKVSIYRSITKGEIKADKIGGILAITVGEVMKHTRGE